MADNRIRIKLDLDFTALITALRQFGESMKATVRAFWKAFGVVAERDLAHRRSIYGGNGSYAREYPEAWESVWCTLNMDCANCPSDEYDLRCTCKHHRRRR